MSRIEIEKMSIPCSKLYKLHRFLRRKNALMIDVIMNEIDSNPILNMFRTYYLFVDIILKIITKRKAS